LILDKGICTVYATENSAEAGKMPVDRLTQKHQSWYGELSFETSPAYPTEYREDVETSSRIRILQNRAVTSRDIVIFTDQTVSPADAEQYEITRAYHGIDEDSGEPITDLTIRRILV